jgi:hypothetical protein
MAFVIPVKNDVSVDAQPQQYATMQNADVSSGINEFSQGLGKVAQASSKAINVEEYNTNLNNKTIGINAHNSASIEKNQAQLDIQSNDTGEKSLNSVSDLQKKIQEIDKKYTQNLNPQQLSYYKALSFSHDTALINNMNVFQHKQNEIANKEANVGLINNNINSGYSSAYSTPMQNENKHNIMLGISESYPNAPKDYIKSKSIEALSKYNFNVVQSMLDNNDPSSAQSYVKNNESEFTPTALHQINSTIDKYNFDNSMSDKLNGTHDITSTLEDMKTSGNSEVSQYANKISSKFNLKGTHPNYEGLLLEVSPKLNASYQAYKNNQTPETYQSYQNELKNESTSRGIDFQNVGGIPSETKTKLKEIQPNDPQYTTKTTAVLNDLFNKIGNDPIGGNTDEDQQARVFRAGATNQDSNFDYLSQLTSYMSKNYAKENKPIKIDDEIRKSENKYFSKEKLNQIQAIAAIHQISYNKLLNAFQNVYVKNYQSDNDNGNMDNLINGFFKPANEDSSGWADSGVQYMVNNQFYSNKNINDPQTKADFAQKIIDSTINQHVDKAIGKNSDSDSDILKAQKEMTRSKFGNDSDYTMIDSNGSIKIINIHNLKPFTFNVGNNKENLNKILDEVKKSEKFRTDLSKKNNIKNVVNSPIYSSGMGWGGL